MWRKEFRGYEAFDWVDYCHRVGYFESACLAGRSGAGDDAGRAGGGRADAMRRTRMTRRGLTMLSLVALLDPQVPTAVFLDANGCRLVK